MKLRTICALGAFLLCAAGIQGAEPASALRIAAAANLSGVLNRLTEAYAAEFSVPLPSCSFGASGAIASQLRAGAPYALFLSADVSTPERLLREGIAEGKVVPYAKGILCAVSPLGVDQGGRLGFLKNATYAKIAMAKPEIAPYGAAAREALTKEGLWDTLGDRIVYGTSIAQAALFVSTRAADAGFVNLSALLADPELGKLPWVRVDPSLYAPIVQGGVVIASAGEGEKRAARDFLVFMTSQHGRSILGQAGYGDPGGG